MRKIISVFIALALLIVIVFSIPTAHAETAITLNGYTYMLNSKGLAVLIGWDNRSDTLYVPYSIGNVMVAEIGDSAFNNDDFIKHLDLHDARRMYHIGEFAFANSVLEGTLTVTTQVTYVGTAAFENCDSITSVVYGSDGGIVSSQCFNGCDALETVSLSDHTTEIKQYAFANCPSLTSIIIPKNVTSINNTAFDNSQNVVIKCYYGSYAAQFAEEKGISYTIIDPENIPTEPGTQEPTHQIVDVTFILGDSDGDGFITILDATKVQRVLADLDDDTDGMITLRAAVDGDVLNIMHATKIQRYLAEFEVAEPIGEEVTRQIKI